MGTPRKPKTTKTTTNKTTAKGGPKKGRKGTTKASPGGGKASTPKADSGGKRKNDTSLGKRQNMRGKLDKDPEGHVDAPDWMSVFLGELRRHGIISSAAQAAEVSRRHINRTMQEDRYFYDEVQDAIAESTDFMEREAVRRGSEGWQEEVYQNGQYAGSMTKFSDNLLMFMLKGRRPETYRDRVDIRGSMQVSVADAMREFVNGASQQGEAETEATGRLKGEIDREEDE